MIIKSDDVDIIKHKNMQGEWDKHNENPLFFFLVITIDNNNNNSLLWDCCMDNVE